MTMLLRLIVVLLSAQFVLGIWVNLFGRFPTTDSVANAVEYGGDPVLTAHYAVAVLVVILAAILVALAFRTDTRGSLRWMTIGGLFSVLWATAAGLQFILSGFSSSDASFNMALAFIVAMTFYGVAQALVLPALPERADVRKSEE